MADYAIANIESFSDEAFNSLLNDLVRNNFIFLLDEEEAAGQYRLTQKNFCHIYGHDVERDLEAWENLKKKYNLEVIEVIDFTDRWPDGSDCGGGLPGDVARVTGSDSEIPHCCRCHRKAVWQIQGETDSFGKEFWYSCEEHLPDPDEQVEGICEWCKNEPTPEIPRELLPTRDYDEGMSGPVYEVCAACRQKQRDRAVAELEEMDRDNDYCPDEDD